MQKFTFEELHWDSDLDTLAKILVSVTRNLNPQTEHDITPLEEYWQPDLEAIVDAIPTEYRGILLAKLCNPCDSFYGKLFDKFV